MEEYYVLLASLIFIEPRAYSRAAPPRRKARSRARGSIVAVGDDAARLLRARVATSVTFAATKAPTLRKPA